MRGSEGGSNPGMEMDLKLVRVRNNDNNFKLSYRSASVTNDREFKN